MIMSWRAAKSTMLSGPSKSNSFRRGSVNSHFRWPSGMKMFASLAIFSCRIASCCTIGAAPAQPNLMPEAAARLRSGGSNSSAKSACAGTARVTAAAARLVSPSTARRRVGGSLPAWRMQHLLEVSGHPKEEPPRDVAALLHHRERSGRFNANVPDRLIARD
jgi:hypothetical protein